MSNTLNRNKRTHYKVNAFTIVIMLLIFHLEILLHLPQLLVLRKIYKQRNPNPDNLSVALIGDNLDEVNGIALHSRALVRTLRKKNRKVFLVGAAFRDKKARMEMRGGSIIMIPGKASMDMPGYEGSEVTIPKIGLMLRLLKRYPVDLFEFETPNTMGWMGMWIGKIVGIKTISHYRTDLITYIEMLLESKLAIFLNHTIIRVFTLLTTPVIVPSLAFKPIVENLGISPHKIHHLPRGVDSIMFHPHKKNNGAWERLTPNYKGFRLIYVGRISTEKNLPWVVDLYTRLTKIIPQISFTIVGEGPYLEQLKNSLEPLPGIFFTGTLRGQDLAGVFASADLLIFPSTTDTFGNSVIEAIASGIPCVVSNKGGPQEIIEDNKSGIIIDPENMQESIDKISALIRDDSRMEKFKKSARERSLQFSQEYSADKFWEFYQSIFI